MAIVYEIKIYSDGERFRVRYCCLNPYDDYECYVDSLADIKPQVEGLTIREK